MKQSDSVDKIRNKVETIAIIYGSKCGSHLQKADSFGFKMLNKTRTVFHKIHCFFILVNSDFYFNYYKQN